MDLIENIFILKIFLSVIDWFGETYIAPYLGSKSSSPVILNYELL